MVVIRSQLPENVESFDGIELDFTVTAIELLRDNI